MNLIKQSINTLYNKEEISYEQFLRTLQTIVAGGATSAQIASIFSMIHITGYTDRLLNAGLEFWKYKNALKRKVDVSITSINPLHISDAFILRAMGFSVAINITCKSAAVILGYLGINAKQDRESVLDECGILISNYVENLNIRRAFAVVESDVGEIQILNHIRYLSSPTTEYNLYYLYHDIFSYKDYNAAFITDSSIFDAQETLYNQKKIPSDAKEVAMQIRNILSDDNAALASAIKKRLSSMAITGDLSTYGNIAEHLAQYINISNA